MSVWHHLDNEDEQEAALENVINKQLAKIGVTPVSVKAATMSKANGSFSALKWTVSVNRKLLGPGQGRKLANTLLHEARHAEQHFRIAQTVGPAHGVLKAYPQHMVQAARANTLAANSSGPAVLGRAAERSQLGAGAAHRNRVLNQGGTYDEYRALPEEEDAHRVGDATDGCP
jgi:hypothetical protein